MAVIAGATALVVASLTMTVGPAVAGGAVERVASKAETSKAVTSKAQTSKAQEFPDETTTGVPDGTELTASGGIAVTEPGTVIDAMDINGNVTIQASDVTITRSRINGGGGYPINVQSGNVVIEDSEITGGDGVAVCCGNFTLRRVNIHDVYEGPRINGNATIEDSYIHHLLRCSGCHIDVLQSTTGSNIRIVGNNLQAFNPDLNDPMNAVYQFGEEQGQVGNCLFEGNLVNGGNYTINGGGGGTTGAECTFTNNHFGRDFRYGPAGNLGPGVVWESSNVWHDTGEPVLQ